MDCLYIFLIFIFLLFKKRSIKLWHISPSFTKKSFSTFGSFIRHFSIILNTYLFIQFLLFFEYINSNNTFLKLWAKTSKNSNSFWVIALIKIFVFGSKESFDCVIKFIKNDIVFSFNFSLITFSKYFFFDSFIYLLFIITDTIL